MLVLNLASSVGAFMKVSLVNQPNDVSVNYDRAQVRQVHCR